MRILVSTLFVAFSMVVGVAAQAGKPGAPPAPGAPQAQQPAVPSGEPARAAKVVIGGCIQNAPAASATGGAAAPVPAAKFVLANAKQVSRAAAGVGAGTSGTVAARYRLEGEEKAIATHLNHQVEITGVIQAAAATPGAAAAGAGPMLRVESVKLVAEKCS